MDKIQNDKIQRDAAFDSSRHLPLIYDELKRLAARHLSREGRITLQPTALVHEAWLRLSGGEEKKDQWNDRSHFFYSAAIAMKWILIEHARNKQALKRGGNWNRVELRDLSIENNHVDFVLHLEEALERLVQQDSEAAAVASLHLFGSPLVEISKALGMSRTTTQRNWIYAKAFLQKELSLEDHW